VRRDWGAFLSHQLQALLRRERGYDDGEVLTSPLGEGAHNWSDLIGFVNHDWPRKCWSKAQYSAI